MLNANQRIKVFLACLPLLLFGGWAFGVGYQPNFIRNLVGPITITGALTATGLITGDDVTAVDDVTAGDDLVVTDQATAADLNSTDDTIVGDDLVVTDQATAADLNSTDDTIVGDDLTVTDVATVASIEFSGGGTPGFERGGNTTIQTRSGDGLAVLSTLQGQGVVDGWDSFKNTSTGAACSGNTGAFCVNDPGGIAWTDGAGTTVGVATAAGLISGDTGISSGAWSAQWWTGAAIPEGSNGMGGYYATQVGRGSKMRYVACSCRVAGSGGTNGVIVALMEDGVEVATGGLVGGDANFCDDAAGVLGVRDFNYTFVAAKSYTLQVKNTTDCAGNPTDCKCDVDITR